MGDRRDLLVPVIPGRSSSPFSVSYWEKKHWNAILFGPSGSGKSSVINMITDKDQAAVSNSTAGCTFDSQSYDTEIGGLPFRIYDTVGLNEASGGTVEDHAAIARLYELMQNVKGGISLLMFCVSAGRMSPNVKRNWHFFHSIVCKGQVPTVLLITGLEREEPMSDWWAKNRMAFDNQNITPRDVGCITAIRGRKMESGRYELQAEYDESRARVHSLMIQHANRREPFHPEEAEWLAGAYATSMLEGLCGSRVPPPTEEAIQDLRIRCGFSEEDARKFVASVEKQLANIRANTVYGKEEKVGKPLLGRIFGFGKKTPKTKGGR